MSSDLERIFVLFESFVAKMVLKGSCSLFSGGLYA